MKSITRQRGDWSDALKTLENLFKKYLDEETTAKLRCPGYFNEIQQLTFKNEIYQAIRNKSENKPRKGKSNGNARR